MFALIDCNNFYASCERLFRPALARTPIVVLSNNDGCVIARSSEAKAVGVKMGVPFYQVKPLCRQHKIEVFSSNYTLYGDISRRVMWIIEENWPHMEIYSIDEAFLDLSTLPVHLHDSFCVELQKKILKEVGMPTSVGIGPTKTLAKIANHVCKKILNTPVFNVTPQKDYWLQQIAVGDVWGVGRQSTKKMMQYRIETALDLAAANPHLIRKQFNVVMMRTVMELQGTPCSGMEEVEPKQTILSSKSFGSMQTEYEPVAQSLSSHCARAVEKLRQQHSLVQRMYIFIHTNKHRADLAQSFQSVEAQFITPTDDLRVITKCAKECLTRIFKSGYYYKKAGICLMGLVPNHVTQLDLFHQVDEEGTEKTERWMSAIDGINKKFGRQTIRLAAEGYSKVWGMLAEQKSPAYTTSWVDLPVVRM